MKKFLNRKVIIISTIITIAGIGSILGVLNTSKTSDNAIKTKAISKIGKSALISTISTFDKSQKESSDKKENKQDDIKEQTQNKKIVKKKSSNNDTVIEQPEKKEETSEIKKEQNDSVNIPPIINDVPSNDKVEDNSSNKPIEPPKACPTGENPDLPCDYIDLPDGWQVMDYEEAMLEMKNHNGSSSGWLTNNGGEAVFVIRFW